MIPEEGACRVTFDIDVWGLRIRPTLVKIPPLEEEGGEERGGEDEGKTDGTETAGSTGEVTGSGG